MLYFPTSSRVPAQLLPVRAGIARLPQHALFGSPNVSCYTKSLNIPASVSRRFRGIVAQTAERETEAFNKIAQFRDSADTTRSGWNSQVSAPAFQSVGVSSGQRTLNDQVLLLFTFLSYTASVALMSLLITAVPTLRSMGRAATSLAKLADTARAELPSTMAAIRLSGMEISDLTLELSDLSKEITDGVSRSTKVVQAAEAGIRHIGTLARERTMSMVQEGANLQPISLNPVVAGAAKKTSRAVGKATKAFINIISRRTHSPDEDRN